MNGLSSTVLALGFVCFSLIALISVNRDWDSSLVQSAVNEAKLSELGLRFNMQP
jgi:hypothetical protein